MPKQTTVVEFDDKEIREILKEKAKQSLGNSIQGGVTIEFPELGALMAPIRFARSRAASYSTESLPDRITHSAPASSEPPGLTRSPGTHD